MAASWFALGRSCARSIAGKRLLGCSPGCSSQLCASGCAVIHTGRHQCALAPSSTEKVTHTGQAFDDDDYRKIRFVGKQKEVNEQFAINLIAEQPVNDSENRIVSCDGEGGALGHPKVYINLDKETKIGTCGYCGLQFKQKHYH
ncbi:NADH dehydrogenase [ubiquinone] iron-sulfur protein 6, mitochondrial [Pseudophryne corroboree]|uniref:NADH dehydrogenase [ubiquinone] iron-sulfur protein 6, mitochondrial n=1 Tax=Pseudophryne corroboree TaxID=495146 RepID=UPI00308146FA